jgi:quercetin dioxygenase-like cupin family protein
MSREETEIDRAGMAQAVEAGLMDVGIVKLLFSDEASSMSLTYAWFKPHYKLPNHSHSADCLYYIISGSLFFGNQELGAGDGFLVPSDNKYRYEVGADGVEILEFRTATKFDIKYGNSESSWNRLTENVQSLRTLWATATPPATARRIIETGDGLLSDV